MNQNIEKQQYMACFCDINATGFRQGVKTIFYKQQLKQNY